ncbi:heat shock protein HslJ [Pseudocitrobacter cyperus]|uniref:Heat shock protein HslJ n=1 Tax=Pseudocitrobacter cyperus TaxID=3112843 RepID=A0ABV0HEA6_9ENTR
MKRKVYLLAAIALLAGCVYNSKVSTGAEQLQHHRFVLESVDGKALTQSKTPLELSFGQQTSIIHHLHVSGNMCNRFNGTGRVSDGALKVKELAMTRKLCTDPQLNELDQTLSTMLSEGAQIDLTESQLTLATAQHTLVYKLSDLVN